MKYKPEEISQMRSNMFDIEDWLRVKNKLKDRRCSECKAEYKDIKTGKIGMINPKNGTNKHLCQSCIDKYIQLGVKDIYENILKNKKDRAELLENIYKKLDFLDINYKSIWSKYRENRINEKNESELNEINLDLENQVKHKKFIDSIDSSSWTLETYLKEEYHVIMNKKMLKHESQIEKYFSEDMYDFFDCGQGYYEDEVELIAKIDNKFYKVIVKAEIDSSKQDHGDRLYWLEGVQEVSYKEIEKPKEKVKKTINISFEGTYDDEIKIRSFLKENGIKYNIEKIQL